MECAVYQLSYAVSFHKAYLCQPALALEVPRWTALNFNSCFCSETMPFDTELKHFYKGLCCCQPLTRRSVNSSFHSKLVQGRKISQLMYCLVFETLLETRRFDRGYNSQAMKSELMLAISCETGNQHCSSIPCTAKKE